MTTGSTDLDAILTGTTPEPVEAEAEPTGEVETPAVEATTPVAEKPPESKPETPPGHVPFQALHDERRKRQDLERELEQLRTAKPPEATPNLFEDPDGFVAAERAATKAEIAKVRQEAEGRFVKLTVRAAKARYPDFDEKLSAFMASAAEMPQLETDALQADDPGEFIYRSGSNLKILKDAGSLEAAIAAAEARGEERARQAIAGKPPPKIPESLTDIAGATGERAPQAFAPKPLSELLPTY